MKITLLFILTIVLLSCQQKEGEKTVDEESFVISNTWMRPGSINRNTAAFMTIKNNTNSDDTLFAVSSDLAKVTEIHETYKRENDMMGMRHIDYLVIPKKSTVELKPGSFHIMLIGLYNDVIIGEKYKLSLSFKNQGEVELDLPVQ